MSSQGAERASGRASPASVLVSAQPFLHCCETWQVLAGRGELYVYGEDRPFHSSWAREPVGMVVQMVASGGLIPRVVRT